MNTIETKKTSMIERLQAMEALWDSLLDEESEIESPEWHQDILEERKKRSKTVKQNSSLLRS
jgi:hypothetical protein